MKQPKQVEAKNVGELTHWLSGGNLPTKAERRAEEGSLDPLDGTLGGGMTGRELDEAVQPLRELATRNDNVAEVLRQCAESEI